MIHPVFKRELLARLRDPLFRWAVLAYLIIPFLFIAGSWPRNQIYYGGSSDSENLSYLFFMTQMVIALIVVPVFGAFAINSERENHTYDFLYLILYRPWTTSMAKLGAILVSGIILFLSSIPSLSFVFYLGGVDETMMLGFSAALLVDTIITAELAILFSAIFSKGYVSLIATYTFYLVFWFTGMEMRMFDILEEVINFCLQAFPEITMGLPRDPAILLWVCTIALLIFSSVCIPLIILLTRAAKEPKHLFRTKIVDSEEDLKKRQKKWPYYIIDPAKRSPPIPDAANPLIPKEQLSNRFFNSAWRWRSIYIFLFISFGFTSLFLFTQFASLSFYYSATATGLLTIWTIIIHSVAVSGEKENRSFENLKLTQLKPLDFIKSKWYVCFQVRWPLLLMCAVFSILLFIIFTPKSYGHPSDLEPSDLSIIAAFLLLLACLSEAAGMTSIFLGLFVNSIKLNVALSLLLLLILLVTPCILLSLAPALWSEKYQAYQKYYSYYSDSTFQSALKWTINNAFLHVEIATSICMAIWTGFCLRGAFWKLNRMWKPE